jgi:predicted RNA-binding Zn-ribbon protein involved in translation (DUF1610 family)
MTQRQRRTMLLVLVPAALVGVAALCLAMFPGVPKRIGLLALVPIFALAWSIKYFAVVHMRATDQAVDELRVKGFKMCVKCRYDLTNHADQGVCPECGATYTREALEREWRKAYPYYL